MTDNVKVTYSTPAFKLVVKVNGIAVGAIKKMPDREQYRYNPHGGGEKGEWLGSVDMVKRSINEQLGLPNSDSND